MTAEQQRIAIATAVGWTKEQYTHRAGCWISPDGKTGCRSNIALPDFLNDLNACAEFEKTLSDEEWNKYVALLSQGITRTWWEGARAVCRAKAEQRCEAFLRTKNLWTDQ